MNESDEGIARRFVEDPALELIKKAYERHIEKLTRELVEMCTPKR